MALFFSDVDLELARDNLDSKPISDALRLLDAQPEDTLEAAQLLAYKFLFRRDATAGDATIEALNRQDFIAAASLDLPALKRQLGWLSVLAMLRGHRQWRPHAEDSLRVIDSFVQRGLRSGGECDPARLGWQAAASMAAAILTEDNTSFQRACDVYRRIVDEHIHPEGYIKGAVDVDGATETYQAQFSATCALVLIAEMAGQAGVDLWDYDNRAVSANTAAAYTYYYYFFPESWRWEDGLTRETTMAIMRREGAFFEMVNRRGHLRGVEQLFAEQRPMFSATGGGLTTLTHSLAPPKKRRWRLF
ncbi:MAG: alginate lyase family protein [Chloroflexi bacterium]|nr:alginate lyase family protein [Chloroflexota bacterium]